MDGRFSACRAGRELHDESRHNYLHGALKKETRTLSSVCAIHTGGQSERVPAYLGSALFCVARSERESVEDGIEFVGFV